GAGGAEMAVPAGGERATAAGLADVVAGLAGANGAEAGVHDAGGSVVCALDGPGRRCVSDGPERRAAPGRWGRGDGGGAVAGGGTAARVGAPAAGDGAVCVGVVVAGEQRGVGRGSGEAIVHLKAFPGRVEVFPGLTPGVRRGSSAEEEGHNAACSGDDAGGGWDPEGEQPADELRFDAREPLSKLDLNFRLEFGELLLELGVQSGPLRAPPCIELSEA